MPQSHRREFLQEVSGGMLAVLVGPSLAAELGLPLPEITQYEVHRFLAPSP